MSLTLETGVIPNTDWRDYAACLHVKEPEIFFLPWTVEEAKAVCQECPVRNACLEYAQSKDDFGFLLGSYGVWGGLSEKERKELRERERQRRRYAV